MRAVILEGNPLEIAEALKAMEVAPSSTNVTVSKDGLEGDEDDDEDAEPVSLEVGRRFLARRELHPNQKSVMTAIYNADDKGILGTELQKRLKYEPAQFRGLMGALGRRLGNTKGYIDYTYFFDQEWETDAGSYRYKFPATSREAVKLEIIDKA